MKTLFVFVAFCSLACGVIVNWHPVSCWFRFGNRVDLETVEWIGLNDSSLSLTISGQRFSTTESVEIDRLMYRALTHETPASNAPEITGAWRSRQNPNVYTIQFGNEYLGTRMRDQIP